MKDKILKLRKEGKKYIEIAGLLNCSVSTVAYYCNSTTKTKCLIRNSNIKFRKLKTAISNFTLKNLTKEEKEKRLYDLPFTYLDVLNKHGKITKCYLTGKEINLETDDFHLDHFIPTSQGGDNSLDNLRICIPEANYAKRDMIYEEFIKLCKKVVNNL